MGKEQDLKVYYTYSRSLGNKMDVLRALVSAEKLDIIVFSYPYVFASYMLIIIYYYEHFLLNH